MSNVGFATLSVIPSMKGAGNALSGEAGGIGSAAAGSFAAGFGPKLLSALGPIGVGAAAALGAAFAGAGALVGIGATFDSAFDTIRIGTGATGEALESLNDDFREVFSSVPTDVDSAGTAIADLNTRLGLTGEPLQALSGQLLELSRITGTDLGTNIETTSRLFGDWGITTEDMSSKLDAMFRISQATGPSVDRLSALMVQFGGPMRQLGFTFEETGALLGKFEKEGVNTELVMGSMRVALGRMAREGEAPAETLRRVMEQIKATGDAGAANTLALELFGARAGPDMAAAIREGRFEVDSLVDTMANGGETIMGASEDTRSFGEQWNLFKNKILVTIEPLATRVFGALGDLMEDLIPVIDGVINAFSWLAQGDAQGFAEIMDSLLGNSGEYVGVFRGIGEGILAVVAGVRGLFSAFQEGGFSGLLDQLGADLSAAWPVIQTKLGELLTAAGVWIQTTGLPLLGEKFSELSSAAWRWAQDAIPPALAELGNLIDQALTWIIEEGVPALQSGAGQLLDAFSGWARDALPDALSKLDDLILTVGEWLITEAIPFIAEKAWGLLGALLSFLVDIVPKALVLLWDMNYAIGEWLLTEMIPGLVLKGIELAGALLGWITDAALAAPGKLLEFQVALFGWVIGLPGKLLEAGKGMWDFIWSGLKEAWNKVAEFFNGLPALTVDVPDILPGPDEYTIGLPKLPTFHDGGVVPGYPGEEVPILALAGEEVLTAEQRAMRDQGQMQHIEVWLGGTKVHDEIRRGQYQLGRQRR